MGFSEAIFRWVSVLRIKVRNAALAPSLLRQVPLSAHPGTLRSRKLRGQKPLDVLGKISCANEGKTALNESGVVEPYELHEVCCSL
jgi:hypothetical protein